MKLGLAVIVAGAVSTCAFAAGGQDAGMSTWAAVLIAIIGTSGAWFLLGARRRETYANAEQLRADADLKRSEAKRNLFDEIDDLYDKLRAERDRNDRLESEVRQTRELMAAMIAGNRMRDPRAFVTLFDHERVAFGVVLSSAEAGRWEWVNPWLCRRLGRTKDEIIRLGWEALVAPEDLMRTRAAERSALHAPLAGFRNSLLHADGSRVSFCWQALEYQDRATTAFAFPEDVAVDIARDGASLLPIRRADARVP